LIRRILELRWADREALLGFTQVNSEVLVSSCTDDLGRLDLRVWVGPQQLALAVSNLDFHFVDVVFKVALLLRSIREDHPPVSVLDASDPFTLIATTIGPIHFSVTIPLVVFVFSFVAIATRPLKMTKTAFTIVDIVSFVAV
jgi:hypothetical protein